MHAISDSLLANLDVLIAQPRFQISVEQLEKDLVSQEYLAAQEARLLQRSNKRKLVGSKGKPRSSWKRGLD